jgi:hypothetical protein
MWTFLYCKLCNHQTFNSLRPTRDLNLWHIVCLNFWYVYHKGLEQLSPCTTASFNGSWRTSSMSSTMLLSRVQREIATESSERAYIPTSPRSQFLEPPCSPWLLSYSKKTKCLIRIKEPFLLSELPTNGSSDQPFLSSGWPTKWLPQILPFIVNNRVF